MWFYKWACLQFSLTLQVSKEKTSFGIWGKKPTTLWWLPMRFLLMRMPRQPLCKLETFLLRRRRFLHSLLGRVRAWDFSHTWHGQCEFPNFHLYLRPCWSLFSWLKLKFQPLDSRKSLAVFQARSRLPRGSASGAAAVVADFSRQLDLCQSARRERESGSRSL